MGTLSKKILVIDDDPDILEAVRLTLHMVGYQTEATTRHENVNEIIDECQPDLIILDVLLSGEDGRNICRIIKENHSTKNIPVLMMSAHPSVRQSVEEVGAAAFIPKPFSIADLVTAVERHLEKMN